LARRYFFERAEPVAAVTKLAVPVTAVAGLTAGTIFPQGVAARLQPDSKFRDY
jgi:hypothetical protein